MAINFRNYSRMGIIIFVFCLISSILADTRYTDAEARKKLEAAGIAIYSSGGCSDQNNPHCTSLTGIHSDCIDGPHGIISFKRDSGCSITITGGTEVGHASGTYSHYNGWKLDVSMAGCVTNYIENHFTKVNSDHWRQPTSEYVYYNEDNHWDCCFNKDCTV